VPPNAHQEVNEAPLQVEFPPAQPLNQSSVVVEFKERITRIRDDMNRRVIISKDELKRRINVEIVWAQEQTEGDELGSPESIRVMYGKLVTVGQTLSADMSVNRQKLTELIERN
jgi:hypothetical protein